jgi:3-oxoacyl-[acyl-carrier protein] reductase
VQQQPKHPRAAGALNSNGNVNAANITCFRNSAGTHGGAFFLGGDDRAREEILARGVGRGRDRRPVFRLGVAADARGREREGEEGRGRSTAAHDVGLSCYDAAMRLEECKIIVTGAAQGLGKHFALRIAEAGGSVAAGDVNEEALAALVEESKALPGKIVARKLDVASEADVGAFVEWAYGAMGGLTGLINNAGILRDGLLVKRDKATGGITKLSAAQWQAVIDVNLTGATFMVRDTVAKMAETGQKGVVVNMSSIARHGNRGQSNYTAAKASLAANTKTWSLEFAPFGIRVGAIAPGMIKTPMTDGMSDKAREALVFMIPVGRIGVPEDIWLGVKFVLESEYFNARCLDLDGGLVM